ncbi:hypothetical protein FACS1894217_02460 [Clostridia bacterium]|nr:hypothetical protein FACS1894217_02460 [Clostridia bacterium]
MWGITANRRRRLSFSNRYQYKIAGTYILIILAMIFLLNTYPVLVSQNFVFQSKQTSMTARAALIASTLAGLDKLTPDAVGKTMALLDDRDLTRLMVADDTGLVVYDTAGGDNVTGRYALYTELYAALKRNDVFRVSFRQAAFQSRTATPVIARGLVIGAVYLYEYDSEQGALLQRFRSDIANLSIAVTVLVLLLSLFMSSLLTRRVAGLLRAIQLVREGEYSHPAPIHGKDELADLAREFNALTARIQRTEELRRQFVSDASHELKTPLASIRLLTDSILITEDMPLTDVRDFVGDIGSEIDRLSRMTEKLMLLTRLDAQVQLKPERVELSKIIRRAAHMLKPLAESADVEIRCDTDENCAILANSDDIYQIVFNLMENAVKYNHAGGKVSVYLYGGEQVTVHVDDTGMGIPIDDMPCLFERFYRVDKARARQAGGAGLGLSIVKNLVKQYNGEISVISQPDKGTRFTLVFPNHKEEK